MSETNKPFGVELLDNCKKLKQMVTAISRTNYPLYQAVLRHVASMEKDISHELGGEIEEFQAAMMESELAASGDAVKKEQMIPPVKVPAPEVTSDSKEEDGEQKEPSEDEKKKEEGTKEPAKGGLGAKLGLGKKG